MEGTREAMYRKRLANEALGACCGVPRLDSFLVILYKFNRLLRE
jgi:hypothetical protein